MKKIIFLTGSVRSGKSNFALKLAEKTGKKVGFIATCAPKDKEMKHRIKLHKLSRPKNWETIEEYSDLSKAINKVSAGIDVVIIDCITLYVSNLMMLNKTQEDILASIDKFMKSIRKRKISAVIVSNEVGWGIVPVNKLARDYRDIAGKVNQIIAKDSDEAYVMISGIPLRLK
jgi:adenosylcobinamide kinase/adenosylcobinamide-phosphate guanylyltransferase